MPEFFKKSNLAGLPHLSADDKLGRVIPDGKNGPAISGNMAAKFETAVGVASALMLGSVCVGGVLFLAQAAGGTGEQTLIAFTIIFCVLLCGLVIFGKATSHFYQKATSFCVAKPYLMTGLLAVITGGFWALVPPPVYTLTSLHNGALSIVLVAGVICVAGLMSIVMPVLTVRPLLAVLISSYGAAYLSGSVHIIYLAISFTVYAAWSHFASGHKIANKARESSLKKTLAKQDKTISLLLRDFDKQSRHWLWEIGNDNKFVQVLDSFEDVSGRSKFQLQNLTMSQLIAPVIASLNMAAPLLRSVQNRTSFTDVQIPIVIKGENRWWSMTGTPDFDENGIYKGFHGVGSDITQQKQSNERVEFLAHHDVLTGLYNRAHFTELLHQNVSRLERYGATFALMFFDLDFFKSVNDSYGHPMGDKLLIEVATRIRSLMPADTTVSRLGGDEFAVIFPDGVNTSDLLVVANATLDAIRRPFDIDDEKLQIGVSIGIAFAPHHGTRPDQLLRNVDLALYRAKENGRNSFCVFEAGMDSAARERRALEFDLRTALEGNELELYYQPFVTAQNGHPIGFEALLRWNHPIRGQISPTEFIPIAESTGLIGLIGEWVMLEACTAAATWPDHLRIAVNLSALQFNKDRIVEIVTKSLLKSGLRADRLELEITESLLIDQPEDAMSELRHLKKLGVSIAMDDFGTGYSSLSYMLKFPFDKIKVDKSFITSVRNESAASDVLRTIASLGKSLKVKMTAEGVETMEQAEFLKELQFDQLQGFYYSKPLRAQEVPTLLLTMTGKSLNLDYGKIVKLRSTAA